MADSIILTSYSAEWPQKFEIAKGELVAEFSDEFLGIEHIGSTAIPGISAKPIIDILVGVRSMQCADEVIPRLLKRGWDTSEEFNRTIGERRFLLKWPDGVRTHHLHLVIFEGPHWFPALVFRDRLKKDSALCSDYENLKHSLAQRFGDDREGYTAAKETFIRRVVEQEGVTYVK